MNTKRNYLGMALLAALMGVTACALLRGQSLSTLGEALSRVNPLFVLAGLGLMLAFVGCEAMCTRLILGRMGYAMPYRRCLGYSFVGFYVSSITPSATGGQPAQIYYMSRDGVPAARGALNMMLIAVGYQTATLTCGLLAFLLLPSARAAMGGGLGLLLLYGGAVMVALTVGMLSLMFLPGAARKLMGRILGLLARVHLVKDRARSEEKLERQLREYAAGAACIRRNPDLMAKVVGLCFLQLIALFSVPYVVYLGFGLTGHSFAEVVGVQALLTLAVSSLPLPGAVGPAEGGFVKAFTLFFGVGLVTPAMLVSRGISFYAFLLISAGVSLCVHLRTRRQGKDVRFTAAEEDLTVCAPQREAEPAARTRRAPTVCFDDQQAS